MYQRDHDRGAGPGQKRPHTSLSRRAGNPVLALQRAIGNRGTTRFLARDKKGAKNKATFANSVQIGKLGPIEITDGNVADWVAKKDPETLTVTSVKGKHADELKRMADGKTRIPKLTVTAVTGQNSWVVITFSNARIKGYEVDADGKEHWQAVDFDAVHREKTSIGVPRP